MLLSGSRGRGLRDYDGIAARRDVNPLQTWHAGGARVYFERAFDSSRGFPGEGPGGSDKKGRLPRRNRESADSVGNCRKFRSTGGSSSSITPDKRQKLDRGCKFPSVRVSSAGSGLPVRPATTTMASTSTAANGFGPGVSGVGGDREAIQHVPSDRTSSVSRRGQMSAFMGPVIRTSDAPSGKLASGANHTSMPHGVGSRCVQRRADEDLSQAAGRGKAASGFRKWRIHSHEERRGISVVHRLPRTEQVRREVEVPNGGGARSRGADPARRLWHAGRPQRRVPHSRTTSVASEILSLPLSANESTLPVEDCLIRDLGGSTNLYKNHSPINPHSEVTGHQMSDLHRRLIASRPGPCPLGESNGHSDEPATKSGGFAIKVIKGKPVPLARVHLLGNNMEHNKHDMPHTCKTYQGAAGDSSQDTEHIIIRSSGPHSRFGAIRGTGGVHFAGNQASETTIAAHPALLIQGGPTERMDRQVCDITSSEGSFGVVDNTGTLDSQRERHRSPRPLDSDQHADGRRHAQRRIRRLDDPGHEEIRDSGIPDKGGAGNSLHQSVRVLRVRKHSLGSLTSRSSRQNSVEERPRLSGVGQRDRHQVRTGRSKSLAENVLAGSPVLRSSARGRNCSELPTFGRGPERQSRRVEPSSSFSRRLEDRPKSLPTNSGVPSGFSRRGPVCKFTKQTSTPILLLQPRPQGGGGRCVPAQLEPVESPVRLPTSDIGGTGSPEVACRLLSTFDNHCPRLASPNLVPDATSDAEDSPTPSPERAVAGDGSFGQDGVAVSVASYRMQFIWKYGRSRGISKDVYEKRWSDSKNGYPAQYDKHFAQFKVWWDCSHPALEFCPSNISAGRLACYLTERSAANVHHDVLRDISTSISMACVEASDQQYQPGKSFTVSKLFEGERRTKPTRRQGTGEYSDMALLYQELWRYGPTGAMTIGQKKKRLVALLIADSAARPSDISRLFRVHDTWKQQIAFTPWGVRIRFFYTKEVVPGSSRDNSTGYWFSSWVDIHKTEPVEISTPELLREFLDCTSGPEYALQHIPELDSDAQPIVFARKRKGLWQPSSVDHISNLVKEVLREAGMEDMTTKSVRGASPSKVVQLFPDLLPEALKLGRWTNKKTFCSHYQAPVNLLESPPPADSLKQNVQQLLRHGFKPTPPPEITAEEYMEPPQSWVHRRMINLSLTSDFLHVKSFNEGIYEVDVAGQLQELYHYEWMQILSEFRSR